MHDTDALKRHSSVNNSPRGHSPPKRGPIEREFLAFLSHGQEANQLVLQKVQSTGRMKEKFHILGCQEVISWVGMYYMAADTLKEDGILN